jgi:hypothetical protein
MTLALEQERRDLELVEGERIVILEYFTVRRAQFFEIFRAWTHFLTVESALLLLTKRQIISLKVV